MTRKQAAHRNGPLSRGPVTEAGKALSSRNAVKHGLSGSKMFVLQNEHPQAWAELLADCVATWKPVTSMEHRAVEDIAGAKWRLRRLRFIETGLFDLEMDQQADDFAAGYDDADESIRQALAFKSLADNSRSLALLSRYETRLERAYQRAVQALKELRAQTAASGEKIEMPNEPVEAPTQPSTPANVIVLRLEKTPNEPVATEPTHDAAKSVNLDENW
ncbi:MAG TPA: hypothetical protein VER03_25710 [Bryobacteraceae bacterium]|nr:hypothetical protein [Bryobacteraceae bacterium]